MKKLLAVCLWCMPLVAVSQNNNGFAFGKITYTELDMTVYPKDTSANAVVLNEFGEAYFDNFNNHNLLVEYHVKIKILKKAGLEHGTFSIWLRKNGGDRQTLRSVMASAFNLENNSMKETKMVEKTSVFNQNYNDNWEIAKFTLPDVRVGSVLDVKYMIESPFIFNFWPWEFQSELPKVRTEYWATIPANYEYNVTLKGYLELATNEAVLLKDCYTPGGGVKADCTFGKYAMNDVPAFVEEEFMTAKSNFISSINYELSQLRHFDGRVDNYTKSWGDVDVEYRTEPNFGQQIKKSVNVWEDQIKLLTTAEGDPMKKANQVYDLIRNYFSWNENFGDFTENGAKKAYETKKGNVADINLSLVGALQAAGLNADPVVLSTRSNGLPHELHPVLSDFNYVVAQVAVGDAKVLLDATEKLLPFGLLPERCLNGKGRLISKDEKETGWVALKPRDKQKKNVVLNLKLDNDQVFRGDLTITSYGYEAFDKRMEIASAGGVKEYEEKVKKEWNELSVGEYVLENVLDTNLPVIEKMKVETSLDVSNPSVIYLNPFMVERWEKNPFKSETRMYPVDLGAPLETTIMLALEYPDTYIIEDLPVNAAVALPQGGGKYLFSVTNLGNKVMMTNVIQLSKPAYAPNEYPHLRELLSQVVQLHQSQIVFKKK